MERRIISPIPDRMDISLVAERSFNLRNRAVEIGVFEGEFTAHNLKHWTGNIYMIDTWNYRENGGEDKNDNDPNLWLKRNAKATENAGKRGIIMQGDSLQVCNSFADGFFDWIYIDAGHTKSEVKYDLQAWWPKLREGGLFSGDDYGDQSDRWRDKYGHEGQVYKWGVIEAVNEFAETVNRQVHVTWMNDKTKCPAWYMVK